MLIAIYAEDLNHYIGKNNSLPWHIPKDLAYFKEKTKKQIVIMGRKTLASLDNKPLPERKNIILTRRNDVNLSNIEIFHSKQTLLAKYDPDVQDLYIIGGREIFALFWDEYDLIYRTKIEGYFSGDIKMPEINRKNYRLIMQKYQPVSLDNQYPLIFETWQRY